MVYIMDMYVDGGCRRNGYSDAIGAAACVLKLRNGRQMAWTKRLPGPDNCTPTSQRAEITAIILALEQALSMYDSLDSYPWMKVTIHTDSKYAHGCMTDWVYKWAKNGWRNSRGQEVANQDIITTASQLDDRVKKLGEVNYIWIPRSENEDADLAVNQVLDDMERERM